VERGQDLGFPGPCGREPHAGAALSAREACGDVQEAVAQRFGFGFRQFSGQQDGLGPGDQIGCCQGEFEPDTVDVELSGG
jgi:hypothetical protein